MANFIISLLYKTETSKRFLFYGLKISLLCRQMLTLYTTRAEYEQGIPTHGRTKPKYISYRDLKVKEKFIRPIRTLQKKPARSWKRVKANGRISNVKDVASIVGLFWPNRLSYPAQPWDTHSGNRDLLFVCECSSHPRKSSRDGVLINRLCSKFGGGRSHILGECVQKK